PRSSRVVPSTTLSRSRAAAGPASVGAPSLRAEPTSRTCGAETPLPRTRGVRAGQRPGRSGGEGLCLLGPLEPPLELGTLDVDVRSEEHTSELQSRENL